MASDSRTNAGVDYVSVYSKMYRFERWSDRMFVIVTSGNLATSQAVIRRLSRDIDDPNAPTSLTTVTHLCDAATYLGQVSQAIQAQHMDALNKSGINGESYFIIGGKIGDLPHDIFLVYAQGNCISPSPDTPFLQIGETKYGKPILDRIIDPETSLDDAARAAIVSLDSTIRSNITVGPPIELAVMHHDSFKVDNYLKLSEQDVFYHSMHEHWNEGLKQAFNTLPRFPWEGLSQSIPEQPPLANRQPGSQGSDSTAQPQDLSQQIWQQHQ